MAPFHLVAAQGGEAVAWKPGRVTVFSLCAFWCDTWKEQIPRVAAVRQAAHALPIDFLTISIDGRWSELGASSATGRLLNDPGSTWSRSVGIRRVPTTLVVDAIGEVRWASYGIVRSADLAVAVRAALAPRPVGGAIYLTFDDFPSTTGSDKLLDVLRVEKCPATFFCIGRNVEARPGLVRRALAEGHAVGSHSWAHQAHQPEHDRTVKLLRALGGSPVWLRLPGSGQVQALGSGELFTGGVIDPYDTLAPDPQELLERIALRAKPGAVVQLHAGVPVTVETLPKILAHFRRRGLVPSMLPKP